jgi:hypothetical protein
LATDLARPAGMGAEDYSKHAARLLQVLQIAYEVQLGDIEELELRLESTHRLEQVATHVLCIDPSPDQFYKSGSILDSTSTAEMKLYDACRIMKS